MGRLLEGFSLRHCAVGAWLVCSFVEGDEAGLPVEHPGDEKGLDSRSTAANLRSPLHRKSCRYSDSGAVVTIQLLLE